MAYRQKQAKFTIFFATKNLSLALFWQLNSALFKYKRTLSRSDRKVFLEEYSLRYLRELRAALRIPLN